MADIALVALGLDATGVQQGEKAAVAALQAVEKAMQQVEKSFGRFNQTITQKGQQTGQGFQKATSGISSMGTALQGLGGPIGQFSSQIAGTVSQIQGMVGAFGVIGGVAITAAAGIATLSAAFVKLTIDGSKVSDQMLDIAETTNLSIDTVQRFSAGMALAGESPQVLERAFKEYQRAVVEAQDETTAMARAFKVIGVDAKAAGKDIIGSFIESAQHVKAYRQTLAGAEATNLIYGRTAGVIARSQDAVTLALTGSRKELEDRLILATLKAVEAGGRLDTQINKTGHTYEVFKQNMSGTSFGGIVEDVFKGIENAMVGVSNMLKEMEKSPTWQKILKGGALLQGPLTGIPYFLGQIGKVAPTVPVNTTPVTGPKRSTGKPTEQDKLTAGDLAGLLGDKGGGAKAAKVVDLAATLQDLAEANRAAKAYFDGMKSATESFYAAQRISFDVYTKEMTKLDEQFRQAQIQNAFNVQQVLEQQLATLKPGTDNYKRVEEALNKIKEEAIKLAKEVNITVLPAINEWLDRLKAFGVLPLPLAAPPPITPTRPRTVQGLEAPDVDKIGKPETRPRIFTETLPSRARRVGGERGDELTAIDEQFTALFDDMLFSTLTARKTVGLAFADLAIGVVDTFAAEFTAALRKEFITPVIESLSNMLHEMITGLFSGGVGGSGAKGFFAGVFKGIGKIFGGIFGGGGTLAPGKFGIAGERGPELIFSGSQPLHIAPVTAGSAGNVFNINVGVNAPNGTVDKKTQDQLAALVMQSVRRAQRNEGAR